MPSCSLEVTFNKVSQQWEQELSIDPPSRPLQTGSDLSRGLRKQMVHQAWETPSKFRKTWLARLYQDTEQQPQYTVISSPVGGGEWANPWILYLSVA